MLLKLSKRRQSEKIRAENKNSENFKTKKSNNKEEQRIKHRSSFSFYEILPAMKIYHSEKIPLIFFARFISLT